MRAAESLDKELYGEESEEFSRKSGKWIKLKTNEKSKRKRENDETNSRILQYTSPYKRQRTSGSIGGGVMSGVNSISGYQNQPGLNPGGGPDDVYSSTRNESRDQDKENRSILDDIISDTNPNSKPMPTLGFDAFTEVGIFSVDPTHAKSTPLKLLSPNKTHLSKSLAMTTPEKFQTPPRNYSTKPIVSPVMKNLVTKNLDRSFGHVSPQSHKSSNPSSTTLPIPSSSTHQSPREPRTNHQTNHQSNGSRDSSYAPGSL